ncbi:hypothetical protein OKA06_01095 [Novosphingobium sp. MW5]|nr:hypothetical protein [Novosphingobium sp. MW5]
MADQALLTRAARWNSACELLNTLNLNLAQSQGDEADRLEKAIAEQEQLTLDLEAPHLNAVVQKLQLIWELDLQKPDEDGGVKRLILADLISLIG